MRIQSIRFSEALWAEIQDAAAEEGISASEYVRESTVFRLGMRWERQARTEN